MSPENPRRRATPSPTGATRRAPGPDRAVPAPPAARRSVLPSFVACGLMFLWAAAFSPEPQVLATIPGIVGALWLAERSRTWLSFVGWMAVFGAVGIGYGYRWLAPTVQAFGGLPAPVSWALTALFGAVGTAHAWIIGFFYRGMLSRGRRPHPLTVAALVAAGEVLPVRLFAWSAGHGAVDVPPLLQLAEWGGVPLVSFALLSLVVPVWELLRAAFPGTGAPGRPRAALVSIAVGVVLFGAGFARYRQVLAEDAGAADRIRVAIVQANVGSERKREATERAGAARERSVEAYRRGSERAVSERAELVVWPETAITAAIPLDDALQTNNRLRAVGYGFLNEMGQDRAFLAGMYEATEGRPSLATGRPHDVRYNVAALRQPGGRSAGWSKYRKVYLIPFGEMTPFGLFDDRLPQKFQMKAGTADQGPLELRGRRIVPFLCYEGILARHVREIAGDRRPDLLVSLTNDSWFTGWEPAQHLNFTRFRAVEHRAPLVRATNTGISAFVGATGDVESSLGWTEEGVLVADVPLVDRDASLYARHGWRFPWVLYAWAVLAWLFAMMRPPPESGPLAHQFRNG